MNFNDGPFQEYGTSRLSDSLSRSGPLTSSRGGIASASEWTLGVGENEKGREHLPDTEGTRCNDGGVGGEYDSRQCG